MKPDEVVIGDAEVKPTSLDPDRNSDTAYFAGPGERSLESLGLVW